MRIPIVVLALAAMTASPAIAQQGKRQAADPYWAQQGQWRSNVPGRYTDGRVHSSNPAFDVYDSAGVYAGSDPDPNVRYDLRRNNPNNPNDSR